MPHWIVTKVLSEEALDLSQIEIMQDTMQIDEKVNYFIQLRIIYDKSVCELEEQRKRSIEALGEAQAEQGLFDRYQQQYQQGVIQVENRY